MIFITKHIAGTIFISAVFCLLTPIIGALAQNWQQFLISRILLGVGMGIKASTVPIFAAENSPASIRGALVMSWQLWTAFGIFLGCSANLAVGGVSKIAWRRMCIVSLSYCCGHRKVNEICPHSPSRFGFHPSNSACSSHSVLPRIATIVREKGAVSRGHEVTFATTQPPYAGGSRSLCHSCSSWDRGRSHRKFNLRQTACTALHNSSSQKSDLGLLRRHDWPTDVR